MEQDPTKLIQQRIAELPADVRNAVQAADLHQKILAVGTKNSLHIDQVGELEDEALLAMLGFSPLEVLGKRLSDALHLPPAAGEKLAADLAADIFAPIRESMKSFVEKRAKEATPVVVPTAPAAVAAPVIPPAPIQPAPVVVPPPAPAVPAPLAPAQADLHKADLMLTAKTLDLPPQTPAPATPAAPGAPAAVPPAPKASNAAEIPAPIYKVDPYREPV